MGGCHRLRNDGFTLVEILMVIVIIGIMAGIAVPSIQAILPSYRLSTAKRDLASLMQLARIKAIVSGYDCYIAFNPFSTNETYTCYLDTNDNSQGDVDNNDAALPEHLRKEYLLTSTLFTDTVDGEPIIRLPAGIAFGTSATKPIPGGASIPDDGITFSGNPPRLAFYPSGRGKLGTIYLQNERGASCALSVSIVGRILVRTWDPENNKWDNS